LATYAADWSERMLSIAPRQNNFATTFDAEGRVGDLASCVRLLPYAATGHG